MKVGRFVLRSVTALALASAVAFAIAAWIYRDIPAEELEARYAGPESKFIEIDGVRFHYRDEGTGPAVVLFHANFANLLDWEPWVVALKDKYRVVRFDFTSHGLTGPDPTGDYSQKRTLELTEKLLAALNVDQVTVAGTSLGGTIAIHYAAAHPDRVQRLILLSPGSLEGRERAEQGLPRSAYVLTYILPRALPEFMLRSGFGAPEQLPESLVDRWYDFWMRDGQRKAQLDRLSQYESGDIEGVLRTIRAPTLLLWGEANTTAKFEQADEFMALLSNTPALTFISYPGVGHMAVQEAGERIAGDVRLWLDTPVTALPDAR